MTKILLGCLFVLGIGVLGCNQQAGTGPTTAENKADKAKNLNVKAVPKHEGWWCPEHGLPEDECWACNDTFCKQCKKDGDWCDKHERPKTQCFKCDPKLKDAWAKKYEAKFGTKPPEPEDY